MNKFPEGSEYPPGYYGKKTMNAADWAGSQIRKWEGSEAQREKPKDFSIKPCICLSRRIGTGALGVANFLSKTTGYRVIGKEILEHMAKDSSLTEKILKSYDEWFPGKMNGLLSKLFMEKDSIKDKYTKQLTKTVTTLAHTDPTIFVGRGTHLILPRHMVLSVRLICSMENRIKRLVKILKISRSVAEKRLKAIDQKHIDFFKSVYHKKVVLSDEFDLVINMDQIKTEHQVALIIAFAFEQKFQLNFQKNEPLKNHHSDTKAATSE